MEKYLLWKDVVAFEHGVAVAASLVNITMRSFLHNLPDFLINYLFG
jgi:hypothetical protein